jgi:hypothetical protein
MPPPHGLLGMRFNACRKRNPFDQLSYGRVIGDCRMNHPWWRVQSELLREPSLVQLPVGIHASFSPFAWHALQRMPKAQIARPRGLLGMRFNASRKRNPFDQLSYGRVIGDCRINPHHTPRHGPGCRDSEGRSCQPAHSPYSSNPSQKMVSAWATQPSCDS